MERDKTLQLFVSSLFGGGSRNMLTYLIKYD